MPAACRPNFRIGDAEIRAKSSHAATMENILAFSHGLEKEIQRKGPNAEGVVVWKYPKQCRVEPIWNQNVLDEDF